VWLIVAGKVMVFASFRAAACHFLAKSILGLNEAAFAAVEEQSR